MWRIPYVLKQFKKSGGGLMKLRYTEHKSWLDTAIESGLVQMVKHGIHEKPTCYWLEPINKDMVLPVFTEQDIMDKLQRGIQATLDKAKQPPKEGSK